MRKKAKISIFLAVITALVIAIPAIAGPPLRVHIIAPTIIATSPNPFTASGSAVESGLICPSGDVYDSDLETFGRPGGRFTILRVLKRFDCTDGSGTFDVRMLVRLNNSSNSTRAVWRVVDGTGNYADLKGNGRLLGFPIDPGISIEDNYYGKVH